MPPPISPTNPLTGHCFCNTITLKITYAPLASYVCHCTDCRRVTGSCFAHNATFPADAVLLSLASSTTTTQDTEASTTTTTKNEDVDSALATLGDEQSGRLRFCSKCGTKMLLDVGAGNVEMQGKVIVPVGVISGSEKDERFKPENEGWCRRREGWMEGIKGAREFEEW